MLKTRILTAVILLAVFLIALFYLPSLAWLAFATTVTGIAAWEWGALMGLNRAHRIALGLLLVCICIVLAILNPVALGLGGAYEPEAWRLGRWFYVPAFAFWLLVVPLWMHKRWRLSRSLAGVLIGMLVLLPAWLALVQLKQAGGEWVLLQILAVVWLADIAAYAAGRTLGRHKLAPAISPGKTWEGAIGGCVAVVGYGFVLAPGFQPGLLEHPVLLFFALVLISVISVIGDLFESLLKRQAGMKDSSSILPGHGGVLDRIDSLTSTLPLVALVWLGFQS